MINSKLKEISDSIALASNALAGVITKLENARSAWPDYQVVDCQDWHPRSVTPPEGVLWASDGLRIWIIHSDNEPIPDSATAVKFWTAAFIPAPPNLSRECGR